MKIIVIGAGGHGKVVADILQANGTVVIGFLDDDPDRTKHTPLGIPVLGTVANHILYPEARFIIGIGSNQVRYRIKNQIMGHKISAGWTSAIHPRTTIAPSAVVGEGTVIAGGAVVNPDASIGSHVIINTSASVDHDCIIEDFVHIAPGVHLAGGVRVGAGSLVGIGASVLPYLEIGAGAIIGAGAVVTQNIPPNTTVVGVPGRITVTRSTDWHLSS